MSDGPSDGYRMQCEYAEMMEKLEKAYAEAIKDKEFVDLMLSKAILSDSIKKYSDALNDVLRKERAMLERFGANECPLEWCQMDLNMAIGNYELKKKA